MLNTEEIIQEISTTPLSFEMKAINQAVYSLNDVSTEVKKRYAAVSQHKVIVTIEILFKDFTVFHSQASIHNISTIEQLKDLLKNIDKKFLRDIIFYALTYKSMSTRDYQELLYYRKRFGPL